MKPIIFTYVMTYGGSLLALVRPFYGFLIYVCFGIVKPDWLWYWALKQGNYSRTIAIALLVGWFINGTGSWRFGRGWPVLASYVGYWVVLVVGALTCDRSQIAWPTVDLMARVFVPLIVGATLIDSVAKLKQLTWVIVVSEGYLAYEFNLMYYFQHDFTFKSFVHGGLDNNGIAITMVSAMGLAFYLGQTAERWWQKAIAFGSAAMMAHVVLFSFSRGGMLTMIVTMGCCFILTRKKWKDYLIFLLAIALVARLAGEEVQKRFMSSFAEEGTVEGADRGGYRLGHWDACWQSLQERPFGVGPNHWPLTAPRYGLPQMAAHSTWMQMGAELGWPGLIALFGIYGTCLVRLAPYVLERTPVSDPWIRYLARMVISSLIGFLISAQFVTADLVELPYYIALMGAMTLKLAPPVAAPRAAASPVRRPAVARPAVARAHA